MSFIGQKKPEYISATPTAYITHCPDCQTDTLETAESTGSGPQRELTRTCTTCQKTLVVGYLEEPSGDAWLCTTTTPNLRQELHNELVDMNRRTSDIPSECLVWVHNKTGRTKIGAVSPRNSYMKLGIPEQQLESL